MNTTEMITFFRNELSALHQKMSKMMEIHQRSIGNMEGYVKFVEFQRQQLATENHFLLEENSTLREELRKLREEQKNDT